MDANIPELRNSDQQQLMEIAAQLKKDFEMEQLNWSYNEGAISAESLVEYLEERIRQIIRTSANKLARLLYRIDVSLENMNANGGSSSQTLNESILCEKILKRTFQKVMFRKAYKKYTSGTHDNNIIDS